MEAKKDDAFCRPLKDLKLKRGTEVFLGLVHGTDGVAGTNERISIACRFIKEFGIATECGMARARSPEVVNGLLRIHAACSAAPASRTARPKKALRKRK